MDAPQSHSRDLTRHFSTSLDLDLNACFGSFLDSSSDQFLGEEKAKTVCDVLSKLSDGIPSDESLIRVRGQLLSDIMSICEDLNSKRDGDLSQDGELSKRGKKKQRRKGGFKKKRIPKEQLNRIQKEANLFQVLGELQSVDEQESYTDLFDAFVRLHQEGAQLANDNPDPSAKKTYQQHQKQLSDALKRKKQALILGHNDTFSGDSNSGIIGESHGDSPRQLQHDQGLYQHRQASKEHHRSTESNDGSELDSMQVSRNNELPMGPDHELKHESSESNGASHHASSVGGSGQDKGKESSRDMRSNESLVPDQASTVSHGDGSELGSRQAAREGELPRGPGHELKHKSSESNGASHHASSEGGASQDERKESSRDIGSSSLMRHLWGSPKLSILGGALTLCSMGGGIQSLFYPEAMISRFFPALSYDIPCISLWIMVVALLLFASMSYIQDSLGHGVFLRCLLGLCLGCGFIPLMTPWVLELPVAFMPTVFMVTGITGGVLVLGGLISYMFSAPEMTQDTLSPNASAHLPKGPPSNARSFLLPRSHLSALCNISARQSGD